MTLQEENKQLREQLKKYEALIEKTDTGIYQLMYEVDNKEYESEVEEPDPLGPLYHP